MCKRVAVFVIIAAIVFGLVPDIASAATRKPSVTVTSGDLKGTLSDATAKPLASVTIKLRKDGKILKTVVSNKKGQFALRGLKAGKYELLLPGLSPLPLRATTGKSVATLRLVMPIRKTYAAAEDDFSDLYEWVVASFEETPLASSLVAVGVIAAVAVPVAVNNSGGSSSHTISP